VPSVGPGIAVVEAAVAPGRAELASRPGARRGEAEKGEGAPAVGAALVVAVPAGRETGSAPSPAPLPVSPQPAPPAAAPAPELASAPVTPPSASPEVKTPRGPVSAGIPGFPGEVEEEPEPGEAEETCAGDEYKLTITELESGAVTIVLEHVAADGLVETLELEGDLEDARSLVLQLSSEGGCVEVEVAPPAATS